jgi:HSP20 family protein
MAVAAFSFPPIAREISMANRYLTPYGRSVRGYDPLLDLHREMNRLFDDVFGYGGSGGGSSAGGSLSSFASAPRLDMHESDDELTIEAELPGVDRNDIDVRLDGDMLTLSGEKRSQRDDKRNPHVSERSYGRFQRTVQLPFRPEPGDVEAEFEGGVLCLRLKKRPETAAGSRRIEVKEGRGRLEGTTPRSGEAGGQPMTSAMSGGGEQSGGARGATGSSGQTTPASTGSTSKSKSAAS